MTDHVDRSDHTDHTDHTDRTDRVDCIVVGAGVVGLAVARAMSQAGREVLIVEAASAIGTGISARNSEVIHAGIHDAPGSHKATLCVRGKRLLYDYCAARHVPHRRLGKLLVATDDAERAALDRIAARARACGVDDLESMSAADAARLEPAVACTAALWSPSSGIVDSHALMLALLADAEAGGATLALSSRVTSGAVLRDGFALTIASGPATDGGPAIEGVVRDASAPGFILEATTLINCAGLDASRVARAMRGFPPDGIPDTSPVKGNYFSLADRSPFHHLVYPVPPPGSLGVHVTLDLQGRARFGPDVEWPSSGPLDYAVDPRRATAFALAIRRYWPDLPDDALVPDYAGFRPRISARHAPTVDFAIRGPADHGVRGLVHLFGIESPGLTSCLAIGETVASLLA